MRLVLSCLVAALLAACAASGNGTPSIQLPALRPAPTEPRSSSGHIYVAFVSTAYKGGAEVFEYEPGTNHPIAEPYDAYGEPSGFAFDSAGYMYLANYNQPGGSGSVFALDPNPRTIRKGVSNPYSIALDANDRLYVANTSGKNNSSVTIYEPHSDVVVATLTSGISFPRSIAIDSAQNLYVANSGTGAGTVEVFPPNSTVPAYSIVDGINQPFAVALGPNGNLYVANFSGNTVSVYRPGSTKPSLTISYQVSSPSSLAIDPLRKVLYVANWAYPADGDITAYKLTAGTFLREITKDVNTPYSIAVDGAGRLYVANFFRFVSIYKYGTGKLIGRIRHYYYGSVYVAYER
ncbi:MAG TPA: NHL repeat-containing protein [Candidatus Tumulicola sp.]|jgi:DNA-binding beta-propeller fold protein YncE